MANADIGTAAAVSWALAVTAQTVVLTVTAPDGTTTTPTVTEAAGVYSSSVPTTLPGRYVLSWSKAAAPAATFVDVLNVNPADPRMLVSLAEAKSMVGLTSLQRADEGDLRTVLAAATIILEDCAGAILVRTVTQDADGGKTGVALFQRPDAITSVTEDSTVLEAGTGYVLDRTAAIIYAGGTNSPRRFSSGRQNIHIVYTVGSAQLSPNLQLAAGMLIKHLWGILSNGHNEYEGDTQMGTTPSGYAVPYRVIDLCKPEHPLPGIG